MKKVFKTDGAGRHLPGVGHRRVGSGARQHALARRPRADGRDRPLRDAVEEDGRAARPRRRVPAGRLAPRRRRRRRSRRRLAADGEHAIKAVCVVHNETSTGVTTPTSPTCARRSIAPAIRRCCMVDTISSLASIDYRHDEWGVDVTVGGSQKGLMLPPGLSFNAISAKALAAAKTREAAAIVLGLGRDARGQRDRLSSRTRRRPTCSTVCTRRSRCCSRKGSSSVFARHDRHAEATRRAVRAWGLEILCADPALYSSTLTGVIMPDGHNADAFRKIVLERFDMSLGQGLGKVAGQGLPHRPSRRLQRPDAVRHARRRRDGSRSRRRPAPQGRRAGGDGLPCRDRDGRAWRERHSVAGPHRRRRGPRESRDSNNDNNLWRTP